MARVQVRSTWPVWRIAAGVWLILSASTTRAAEENSREAAGALAAEAGRLSDEQTAESLVAAVELYRQAIELWREAGDFVAESETGLALGEAYRQQGEIQRSKAAAEGALAAARLGGQPRLEIRSLLGIGMALGAAGEGRRALGSLEQARELLRQHPAPELEADVVFHIAVAHERLGEYQEALERYHEVLPIFRNAGNARGEAAALNNLGTVAYDLGDLDQSRRFYRQVVPVRRQLGDAAGEARAWTRVGEVDQALGELRQARKQFQRALALARQAGDRRGEANTLNFLGQAYLELDEPELARERLEQALTLGRALPSPRIEAFSLELLGRLHERLGELNVAVQRYADAAAVRRSTGHLLGELEALAAAAGARFRLGDLDAALADTTAAIKILESLRGRTTRQELRTSLFASKWGLYELHIGLLMAKHQREPAAGHDARALTMVERSRARSLLDQLAETAIELREGVDPELLERERELGDLLDARVAEHLWLDRSALAGDVSGQEAALTAEIEALVAELRQVRGRIRYRSPGYAALTAPEVLDAAAIREQLLDSETRLLVYQLGDERSFLWNLTRERLTSHELPPRAKIEGAALTLYELLTARNRWQDGETLPERQRRIASADAELPGAARELSALVLPPFVARPGDDPSPRWGTNMRLAVVGDGLLHIVPFAILPLAGDEEPMITRHEVVHLPSASALAMLRQPGRRPPATESLLVLADPVLQRDSRISGTGSETRGLRPPSFRPSSPANPSRLPRLRFSRREAESLAALLSPGEATVLLDFAASRRELLGSGIERYRIVHFATHALVDDQRPELTGLALSRFDEGGRSQAAFLRLHEIQRLRLSADLVTLSACETALGRPVDGEGLIGMVRGFFHAGAARVVASLWSVQDRATAELMTRFYRAILIEGQRPAAALRQAQITLRDERRFAAPYFWAPFVLQGEWR